MLDTNMVIYTIKNKPSNVRIAFNKHSDQMCISSVTYMKLVYGAEKSSKPEQSIKIVEGFIARLDVLPFDELAAVHSGQIRAELAAKGTAIGPDDQMIAGHARSRGLRLDNWI